MECDVGTETDSGCEIESDPGCGECVRLVWRNPLLEPELQPSHIIIALKQLIIAERPGTHPQVTSFIYVCPKDKILACLSCRIEIAVAGFLQLDIF